MTTPPVVEKQVVDIDFSKGLNERTAPESLDWSKYLRLADNVDFGFEGQASPRPGLFNSAYTGIDDSGTSLASFLRVMSTGNGIIALAGTGADPYKVVHLNESDLAILQRKNRGSEYQLYPQTVAGLSGVYGTSIVGAGYTSLYKVVVYAQSGLTDFNVVFIDQESGNVVKNYLLNGPALAQGAMTIVSSRYIHVFIGNAAGCKDYVFDTVGLASAGASVPTGVSCTTGTYPLGAVTMGTSAYVLMSGMRISKFSATGTETNAAALANFGAVHDISTSGSAVYVIGVDTAGTPLGVVKGYDSTITPVFTQTDTDATLTAAKFNIGTDPSGNHSILAFLAKTTGAFNMPICRYMTMPAAGSAFVPAGIMPGWGEGCSPFYNSTVGEFYAVLTELPGAGLGQGHDASLVVGSTVLVNLSGPKTWSSGPVGFHVACITDRYIDSAADLGPTVGYRGWRQHMYSADSGLTLVFAMPEKIGPGSYTCEFRTLKLFDVTGTVCSTNVVSGGKTSYYDGASLSEFGCLSVPTITAVDTGAGTGPTTGVQSYTALFEFVDATGRRHLSRCANPFTITASSHAVTVTLSFPAISDHQTLSYNLAPTTNYNFKYHIYRTGAGLTQYHRVASAQVNIASATTSTITYSDVTTDTVLASGDFLHRQPGTQGTSLDRYYAPASSCVVRHKDRVFCARGEDVYYSSFDVFGEAAWFNPAFQFRCFGGTGPITALATMDGVLVAFKKNAIFIIDGDGPPENGGSGVEFSAPRKLMTELGCIDVRSLVTTNDGLLFRSNRGIERLSRKMTIDWVGERIWASVNANQYTGGSAFDTSTGRVIWIVSNTAGTYPGQLAPSSTGYGLVYDTSSDTWSRYVLRSAAGEGKSFQDVTAADVGSATWGIGPSAQRFIYASATSLWFEYPTSAGVYWDYVAGVATYAINTELRTGWIRHTSKQDRVRVADIMLMGNKPSGTKIDGDITISYAKNYVDTFTTVKAWTNAVVGSVWGYDPNLQLMAQPPVEQCQAMSFKIRVAGDQKLEVGALTWSGITVKLGVKGGGAKLPSGQKG